MSKNFAIADKNIKANRMPGLIAVFLMLSLCFNGPLLGQSFSSVYNFASVTTTSGLTDPTILPTASGVTFSAFTAVGYAGNPNASGRFSFTGNPLGATNGSDVFTGSLSATKYYEFSVQVAPNYTASLTQISFTIQRSATGIRQYAIRSNADNFASNLPASVSNANLSVVSTNVFQITDATTSAVSLASTVTLSGANFTDLAAGTTRVFRIYGWNAEAAGGSFSVDDVTVSGQSTAMVSVVQSSPSQVSSGNVEQGATGIPLSQFQIAVANASTNLNELSFTTAGTYSTAEVSNYKIYYNASSNTLTGATLLSNPSSPVTSGGQKIVTGLNLSFAANSTIYFFITADISATAVLGNTVSISQVAPLVFSVGSPTGTISSGGIKTFIAAATADCAGVAGGSALPGTTCDDNNACTINDVWSASCVCAGTIQDTDGDGTCDATDECDSDPNKILAGACGCGNIEVGQVCNDNNACTENDVITACGVCAGTALLDTDSDGTCDLTDECDSDPNKILAGTCGCGNAEPTSACDDGNALTSGDAINGSCSCQGLYPSVYYDFGTAAFTTNTITNLAASAVIRGNNNGTTNGLLNSTSASSGYAGSSGTNNAGAAARAGALDLTPTTGSAYFEFNLDADQNYVFTMTEVSFGVRSTGTGPQAAVLRSSLDGYTSNLATVVIPATSAWVRRSMALSNFSTIAGANVTYRIYGSNGTGSPTANQTNWRIDDLNVFGYTTFTPPVSIVQFVNPTQSANESLTSDLISVNMDIAPVGDVVLSVADLGTGTATALSDYTFLNTSLTFSPTETYPLTKTVNLSILNDSDVEPSETINFGLSLTSGTATLGTSNLVYTLTSDDLAQLVINEIDYDNVGTDNSEWIEIKNNGATAVDINGYKLELVNGSSTPASVYSTINIATTSTLIQPGGYYVVGNNAAIANVNFVFTGSIQNGAPDAIGLRDNSNNLLDAVSYEGSVGSPYSEGLTTNELVDAASANFATGTIGRFPDGVDTGDNMLDLRTLCVGTPGATNTPSTSTFYEDNDADTFGNVDSTIAACEAPVGYVSNSTDCNDTSAVSYQGAVEICDGLDNDCDNVNENGLTFNQYFADADADGAGNAPVAYYQSVANEYMYSNSTEQPIQTFTTGSVSVNGFVVTLPLGTCKQNGLTGAEVEIVTVLNGEPEVTNVMGSYSVPESAILGAPGCVAGFYGKVDFNFSSLILQPNSQYGIVLKLNNPIGGAGIAWKRSSTPDDVSDPYPGGMIWNQMTMFPGNSNLMSNNNLDLNFEIFEISKYTYACSQPASGFILGNLNNLDCNDLIASINPSSPEICDGIDNDCASGVDNGLTFVNYYNDADGDTYGSGTATNACQSPGATYVTNNTDCNDALSAAYPGGTEVCGNGIDDDCLGGDLICPVSPFEAASNIVNIGQFGTGVQSSQTVNLATGTNTVQSPGLGLDKWYKFTATANAMRIAVVGSSSVADDNDLSLYETPVDPTVQLIPIVSENDVHPGDQGLANDGGSETLIYDQLNVGDVYYLCVRNNNNTAGNVSLTLSNLNASSPDIAVYTGGTNTFTSACQNFKVRFRPNASGYTINRWNGSDISGTAAWSYGIPVTSSVASTICQLGRFAPANLSGTSQTVFVTVDVLYNLKDAYGTTTPATARAVAASSFQLASEADLAVRTTDRCSAGFKSATSSIATNRSVCGTSRYLWEMSMVLPLTSLPLEVQGPVGGSRVLMLNAVSGMANGQRYDVRIASTHVDGATQSAFGTSQCVKTVGAAGMPTIEEEVNMYERSENGITTAIYPNPNNGQTVNFSINGLEGSLNLKVTDATGREVYNNRFMVEGSMNTTLDFGQTLADGVYMVEMLQNGEMKTMRMVVSK